MLSDKWVSVDTIIERLGRSYPDLSVDRNNAAEWCFEVVKDVGTWPGFTEERGMVLPVVNNRVELPCNMYKLLSLLPNSTALRSGQRDAFRYQHMGSYVLLPTVPGGNITEVVVDGLLFEVDEHGLPMVYERAADACFYYILMRLKEGDFISGTMRPDAWQYILAQYQNGLTKAKSSFRFTTREDMDAVVRVARSMVRPTHYTN